MWAAGTGLPLLCMISAFACYLRPVMPVFAMLQNRSFACHSVCSAKNGHHRPQGIRLRQAAETGIYSFLVSDLKTGGGHHRKRTDIIY
jgi:hypothetical protein